MAIARRILVVDDDAYMREATEAVLRSKGYEVEAVSSAAGALLLLQERAFDLILSDVRMPGLTGMELLAAARAQVPDTLIILMTAYGTIEAAVEAMKRGAFDYLQKGPDSPAQIEVAVERALRFQEAERENRRLRTELRDRYSFASMVGRSRAMQEVFDLIETVADSRATVLVTGESGTGKELVARALHYDSCRRAGPFVRLNCAALPAALMESELFGHEKGAYTGADRQTRGRFEMADGGSLLLDEIGEIEPALQGKLLRVLQEREFERVGGGHTIRVDVRIIATTNRDLARQVRAGAFREDLFYRLNVIEVALPPLRERLEDIPALVRHFVERYSAENGKRVVAVSDEALELLQRHDWPGNVRELENCVERAVIMARSEVLTAADFPQRLAASVPGGDQGTLQAGLTVREMERRLIEATLRHCAGNRTRAAAMLGISPRTLRSKLHDYNASEAHRGNPRCTGVRP